MRAASARTPGEMMPDVAPFAYPRVSNGSADIGAYEVEQNDIVFNASFESCNPIPI